MYNQFGSSNLGPNMRSKLFDTSFLNSVMRINHSVSGVTEETHSDSVATEKDTSVSVTMYKSR